MLVRRLKEMRLSAIYGADCLVSLADGCDFGFMGMDLRVLMHFSALGYILFVYARPGNCVKMSNGKRKRLFCDF